MPTDLDSQKRELAALAGLALIVSIVDDGPSEAARITLYVLEVVRLAGTHSMDKHGWWTGHNSLGCLSLKYATRDFSTVKVCECLTWVRPSPQYRPLA